jgi:hypothetical protein
MQMADDNFVGARNFANKSLERQPVRDDEPGKEFAPVDELPLAERTPCEDRWIVRRLRGDTRAQVDTFLGGLSTRPRRPGRCTVFSGTIFAIGTSRWSKPRLQPGADANSRPCGANKL